MQPATDVLVLGYGSDIRTDDAVGRRAVELLAARHLPGVATRSVHQLTPELAAELGVRRVVFVDASVHAGEVTVTWLDPAPEGQPLTHHLDPPGVLAFARLLGCAPQEAAVVSVPVASLAVGEELSPAGARACAEAVDVLVALCGG